MAVNILYTLLFIGACLVLVRSGAWTVRSLMRIGRFLSWKEFTIAFILMAFATSIPELFVGITSAFSKIPQLSFGNILGANVLNLSLTIGLVILILGSLEIEKATVRRNSIFMAVVALLPLLMILDSNLSRIDGAILIIAFVFYLAWLFDRKELFTKIYDDADADSVKQMGVQGFLKSLGVFFGSVALLLISAYAITKSALFFAQLVNVPLEFIGILLVGAGTTLPELYFSIRAGRAGQEGMILGNLMGTIVINSTFVLGIVALIHPVVIADFSPYFLARIFLIISVLVFLIFSRTTERISRKEATILILIYILFLLFEISGEF